MSSEKLTVELSGNNEKLIFWDDKIIAGSPHHFDLGEAQDLLNPKTEPSFGAIYLPFRIKLPNKIQVMITL